ncbi:MAG: dihydropteroate synthase [Acidimicrobiia bacterium]|nr:dihydropteroate synthase [Acidimicrobiia bacterium]MDH3399069.1 dihydropteroate synthase [Acidimicrobiia bacterium]
MQSVAGFQAGGRRFEFPGDRTHVMGVINVSPESRNKMTVAESPEVALAMARAYRDFGASIIDLGAQSSHYENVELSVEDELQRLLPALESLVQDGFVVAVDTWKPKVASAAVSAGAAIVNDTGGLRDPAMVAVVVAAGVPAVAMYIEGDNPLQVDAMEFSDDKAANMAQLLGSRLATLAAEGISDLLVDPGLSINYRSDYRRYTLQQMEVIRKIGDLRSLGHPVLIPVPRKREFSRVMAYTTLALEYGADVIRVHDVEAACDLVRLYGRDVPEVLP